MDNFENLKKMSKEELADFLADGIENCPYCRLDKYSCEASIKDCRDMILIWLNSEVEND